jgi:hypothetical protein
MTWTGERKERIVAAMTGSMPCALCGDEIDVGQAWMEADREGERVRAHAGCVYRDEAGGGNGLTWEPQDQPPS